MSKARSLHMIGNAHIDPVWLWQWQEGLQEVLATFRSMLDRMREYPEFIFTSSSGAFYEWVETVDPHMFAEIKERVAEGRWQIVGGWWIQPDCNIPCGESFVRQALYGQRYFREKLGVVATVGYNPDSFGHHAMLPQILKKSGLNCYVFMRPGPHEKTLPGRVFWWEADDGSRVLAGQIPYVYNAAGKIFEEHVRRCADDITPPLHDGACYYGVGNHGGGPTIETIETIRRLQGDASVPRLVFSSPARFFAAVTESAADLPVVHDELQHHASGCYAAHSGVKQWNRQAENLLLAAEKWSAIAAAVTGLPYPRDMGRAWKNVLFCQFHDILAGTSVEAAYEDARALYGEAASIAGRALNDATQSIAWRVAIPERAEGRPMVVFNPHAWPLRANVDVEFARLGEQHVVLDERGREVPAQSGQPRATVLRRQRLIFVADLPALGYRLYWVAPQASRSSVMDIVASDTTVETHRWRLDLDIATGCIADLYDKEAGCRVFAGPAATPVVINAPSDTWSHGVFRFEQVIGAFAAESVRLVEKGPVKAVIRVRSRYGDSRLVQDFAVYTDLDRIDVHVTVDWRERQKMLKLRFPVNLTDAIATYEIPYGHIVRPKDGEEEPGQSWVDLTGVVNGHIYGLSILNDGKYSFDVTGHDIGLTVLRSPIYAHHVPAVPDPDRDYSIMDQGVQRFRYSLLPHRGTWREASVVRVAAELNQPPILVAAGFHPGADLPPAMSFGAAEPDSIVVSVIKQAEDGNAVIVRAYETAKVSTGARIALPAWQRTIHAEFGPCEIKTFRVPLDPNAPVVETDLVETPPGHAASDALQ